MMSTMAGHRRAAPSARNIGRIAVAVLASLCANALLVAALAAWDARKQDDTSAPPAAAPPMVIVSTRLETEAPAAPDSSTQLPQDLKHQPPDAGFVPEIPLSPTSVSGPSLPRLPATTTPDLASWRPMAEFALPKSDARPSRGTRVTVPAAITRGPVMLAKPDLTSFYPFRARSQGITGETDVRLTVDRTGRVTDVTVLRSRPARVFDSSAVRACRQLLFQPALQDGKPVAARFMLKLVWRLEE